MVATTIGNTAAIIILSDNATPGSGTYAWYIAGKFQFIWGDKFIESNEELDGMGGVTTGTKGLVLDMEYRFDSVPVVGWTDYENLRKALFYWSKNDTKLYLSIKPQNMSSNNIAVACTNVAPTTLIQFTTKIRDYAETEWTDNKCMAAFRLPYISL